MSFEIFGLQVEEVLQRARENYYILYQNFGSLGDRIGIAPLREDGGATILEDGLLFIPEEHIDLVGKILGFDPRSPRGSASVDRGRGKVVVKTEYGVSYDLSILQEPVYTEAQIFGDVPKPDPKKTPHAVAFQLLTRVTDGKNMHQILRQRGFEDYRPVMGREYFRVFNLPEGSQ